MCVNDVCNAVNRNTLIRCAGIEPAIPGSPKFVFFVLQLSGAVKMEKSHTLNAVFGCLPGSAAV